MRYAMILGAAALVAASPAPQAFDFNGLDALPTPAQGPPVGVGAAKETAYSQKSAQAQAAAAVQGAATAQAAKKRSLEERTLFNWWWWAPAPAPAPASTSKSSVASPTSTAAAVTSTSAVAPTTTSAAVGTQTTKAPSTTDGVVPSSCTPVDWVNTWAFTADPACPTAIEVGTYCGFINPLDPCSPQPADDASPPPKDDTPEGFLNNPDYKQMAVSAKTPSGYDQAFVNLPGAVVGNGYLAYKTLKSYDVDSCSKYCDETDTCTGFNIWIERDPKWNPDQCSCNNPPSIINYKCAIWGQKVTKEAATNDGQWRDAYHVVVTASNGYNKGTYTAPTPPNTSNPQSCGNKIHDQPQYCMGQKTFPGPFDPSLCAAYAQKQNEVNRAKGIIGAFLSLLGMNRGGCVQFQAAYLEKSGKGFGTHCRLFTKKFTPAQATFDISVGGTSKWGCQKSYTWEVDVNASFNWLGFSWKN